VFTFRTIEPTLPLAAGMTSAEESWSQGSGDSHFLGPPLSASGLTTGIPSGQQAAASKRLESIGRSGRFQEAEPPAFSRPERRPRTSAQGPAQKRTPGAETPGVQILLRAVAERLRLATAFSRTNGTRAVNPGRERRETPVLP
jgi:hypothetical protein